MHIMRWLCNVILIGEIMDTRHAKSNDIDELLKLQKKFHVDTISPEDKPDGFVTTALTKEQWQSLIEDENGVSVLTDDGKIIGYALAASWHYWKAWPLFSYMIDELHNDKYKGETMTVENSYQYGPICILKEYRNSGAFEKLFFFSLKTMKPRFKYLLTFVNQINPRSFNAHTRKVGLDIVKEFEYNNNKYWELGTTTDRVE